MKEQNIRARHKGVFIVVEGLDGVGKTSTEMVLKHQLAQQGKSVILTHEPFIKYPDGKPYQRGQKMFKKIQDPKAHPTHAQCRNLFAQNAKEHMDKVVRPALKKGKTVISDRGILSTLAYQGNFKHVNGHLKETRHVLPTEEKTQGKYLLKPDMNVYLYLNNDDEEIDRINGRAVGVTKKEDRFDKALMQKHQLHKMRQKYNNGLQYMKAKWHVPFKTINAHYQPEQRAKQLQKIIHSVQLHKQLQPQTTKHYDHNFNQQGKEQQPKTKSIQHNQQQSRKQYTRQNNFSR